MKADPEPNPDLAKYECLADLPLAEFNKRKNAIYVIDYHWRYLFVNDFARQILSNIDIVGKTIHEIWQELPNINFKPLYSLLRESIETKSALTLKSTSPLTGRTIEIKGTPLSDCYYFSVIELPDKESLISELKSYLKKG